ncbi:MAG: hypothetical protein J6N21_09630 [Butyrivibrio sp.]|nr:hypothetical protein [Butyrivibrio sp.]
MITSVEKCEDLKSPLLGLLAALLLAGVCIFTCRFLSDDSIEAGIQNIEAANDMFLPIYLGYFFVAFGIKNDLQFWIVAIVLFFTLAASRVVYYNPLFHLFGYKFYYVIRRNEKILVISRKTLHGSDNATLPKMKRINDYTYIDVEKTKI